MKKTYGRAVSAGLAAVVFLISGIIFTKSSWAQTVYGCPDDKTAMLRRGTCPNGKPAETVEEGYICQGKQVILDTLSDEEKKQFGIIGDNKVIIVVYESPEAKGSSFYPDKDNRGRDFKKNFVELKFNCAGVLSSRQTGSGCKPMGDTTNRLEERKRSMQRTIDESKSRFYEDQRKAGATEEETNRDWERYKSDVYTEYNYDPTTGKFINQ